MISLGLKNTQCRVFFQGSLSATLLTQSLIKHMKSMFLAISLLFIDLEAQCQTLSSFEYSPEISFEAIDNGWYDISVTISTLKNLSMPYFVGQKRIKSFFIQSKGVFQN
jgi:predicted phosphoadenosine phosphosulfate sulfurtransferase